MKVCFVLVFSLMILTSLVSASFTKGDYSIETDYGAGEFLRGRISISFEAENRNSLFSCFNSEISVFDFLENSGEDYECAPEDCEDYYSSSGSGESVKTFSLNKLEEKIIGLIFQGELGSSPVHSVSFKVESDAGKTCSQPLKIDILNDKEVEWHSFSPGADFPCSVSTGCFNPSETLLEYEIGTIPYCEKIKVPAKPNFEIGAYIIEGTGSAEFKMQVYDEDLGKLAECVLDVESTGENSCVVSLNLSSVRDIFFCLRADEETDYKIRGEEAEPCGFYGLNAEEFTADYHIFAKGSTYAPVGVFVLNEQEFERQNERSFVGYLNSYLDRFDYECPDECVIPIKFSSGLAQEITLSELQLVYDTTSGRKSENNFYDVVEEEAEITTEFIELDLSYGNFSVPSEDGSYDAKLYLGEELLVEQEINVFASINIVSLNSQQVPAAVPYKFIVQISPEKDAALYTWDFGDGTEERTIRNEVIHTYSSTGDYNLRIEVEDTAGRKAIKNFPIKVVNPRDFIGLSLKVKKENLNETIKNLETIDTWYKQELEEKAALEDIEAELGRLERRYELASSSEEYVDIMSELIDLDVPYSLQSHDSNGSFFLNERYINPAYLISLGAREVENPEQYKNSIINWFNEHIDMTIDGKIYYLYYADESLPLLTYFKADIKPKKDFGEVFLIIDRSYDQITFKPGHTEKVAGLATAIVFSELSEGEEKIVEFILPEKMQNFELPLFISPEFLHLLITNVSINPCNLNAVCEKEAGETAENCPSDCRPWKRMLMYVVILFFVAFMIYIVLQEWYKKYYENRLFKNKNDLFNLISFMNNALNQRFSKKEIIRKLKAHKWSVEQIIYAFKKREGKRTGMWEIPIFKWLEKRKVKKEIAKRQQLGLQLPKQY